MDHARLANVARAKETFCFESKWLPFNQFAPISHLPEGQREMALSSLRLKTTWKPLWWLKGSGCPRFSLHGTSLSRGGLSGSKLLEGVLRRSWLGCWLFSYRLAPSGMERKTLLFLVPWIASIPRLWSPTFSQVFQPVKGISPRLKLPPRLIPGDSGVGLPACDWWARPLNGLVDQSPGWVVHTMILLN